MTSTEKIRKWRRFLEQRMDPDYGLLNDLLADGTICFREMDDVRGQNCSCNRNTQLLNYILEKDRGDGLIKALRNANQENIANFLDVNGEYADIFDEEWPLTDEKLNILDTNRKNLVDLLELTDLLGRLYSSEVINNRQRDSVSSKPTSHEKNEALLDILRRRSLRDYHKTIICLQQTKQERVAEILEKGGVIVRISAKLYGENASEHENEIVTRIENLLSDCSIDQSSRIIELLHHRVIAARTGQSIVLYKYCKTIEELEQLNELFVSGQLKESIEMLFKLHSPKVAVSAITISDEEVQTMRTYFKANDHQSPSKTKQTETMVHEGKTEETKPYDAVIDTFVEWQVSNLKSVQKTFEFAKSSESDLKKAVKFLANITSPQTQRDREKEILSAFENLMNPTGKGKMSGDISDIAKLLVKLVKEKKTEAMLLAILADFEKYSKLQEKVNGLRINAYEQEEEIATSGYLSLHQLVVNGDQQFPATHHLCKAILCLRIMFLLSAMNKTLQDDDRKNANLTETENANHELTSNRIKKILEDFFENDIIKAEQLAKSWPSEIKEDALKEVTEIVSKFKSSLMGWVPQRLKTVKCLREMSEDLYTHNKNVAISQTVASSTSILATVLAIIGIGLTPVTFGASLVLTITGAVLGGASAATHAGSMITKYAIDKNKKSMLEELIEKEKEELEGSEDKMRLIEKETDELEGSEDKMRLFEKEKEEFEETEDKIRRIEKETDKLEGTVEKMRKRALKRRLFKLHAWIQASKRSSSPNEPDNTSRNAMRVVSPIVHSVMGVTSGEFAISAKITAEVAGAAAKVASRVALGVGGALSVLTLPFDIADILLLANDLKNGAQCATGEEVARLADKYEAEAKSIHNLIEYHDYIANVVELAEDMKNGAKCATDDEFADMKLRRKALKT